MLSAMLSRISVRHWMSQCQQWVAKHRFFIYSKAFMLLGYLCWLLVLIGVMVPSGDFSQWYLSDHQQALALLLMYGALYAYSSGKGVHLINRPSLDDRPWRRNCLMKLTVLGQLCMVFALAYQTENLMTGLLLALVAPQLALIFPIWLNFAICVLNSVIVAAFTHEDENVVYLGLLLGALQLMLMFTAIFSVKNQRTLESLMHVNSELRSTQRLLAETSRQGERLRIARDLHDLLGHHITALSINLEIAKHLTQDRAREQVESSLSIARLLLSDIREVVSELRDDAGLDLAAALEELVEGIPVLKIHLELGEDLKADDAKSAEALLRCCQEAITNTLKHTQATRMRISLYRQEGNLELEISDNGGAPEDQINWGNGLKGIQERLKLVGGSLSVAPKPNHGVFIHAIVPSIKLT